MLAESLEKKQVKQVKELKSLEEFNKSRRQLPMSKDMGL
jgi:hypothetical protein